MDPRNLVLERMGPAMVDLTRMERNIWFREGWLDPGNRVLDALGPEIVDLMRD